MFSSGKVVIGVGRMNGFVFPKNLFAEIEEMEQ